MESPQNAAVPPSPQQLSTPINPEQYSARTATQIPQTPTQAFSQSTQTAPQAQMPPQSQVPSQDQPLPDPSSYPYDESEMPLFNKPMREEVLLEWTAPSRPFKKHNRQFYSTVGVIAGLIALILFFAGQVIPVAVVLAAVFMTYVMNSIEPGNIIYKFTTYGIRIENELYYWEELGRFWIKEKYGKPVLYIEVARFPGRLTILLGKISSEDMSAILSEVLLNEEPPPTTYEKAAKWLHEKIPIDLES